MKYLDKRGPFLTKHENTFATVALLKLINSYFWRSISGPFLSFCFPIILTAVLGFSLGYTMAFPGAFFIGIIAIGLNVMPATLSDFRKSSLLKRISVTPIKPIRIFITICLYYLCIMIVSLLFTIAFSYLIFVKYFKTGQEITMQEGSEPILLPSLKDCLANIDYAGFIYSAILIFILSLTTGLFLCSIFSSPTTINSVSIMIMILTILLSGLALPNSIMRSNESLWYCGYFLTPFKSVITFSFESWNHGMKGWEVLGYNYNNLNNSGIFEFKNKYEIYSTIILPGVDAGTITILDIPEKIATLIIPFAWITFFSAYTGKKFKWSVR